MSEKRPGEKVQYVLTLCVEDSCSKKKVKAGQGAEFKLVGILAVAVKTGERIRLITPLAELELDEFRELANKHGVPLDSVVGYATEVKEETKGERVLKLE